MGAELNPPSSAPAPLGAQWHGAGLTELIERLRAAGFRAGAAETVSAGRLLARLAATPKPPTTRAELLPWLRPVFCSTREEQADFDAVFFDWAKRFGMVWRPGAAAPGDPARGGARPAPAAAAARRWGWRSVAAVCAGLALAAAIAWQLLAPRLADTPIVKVPDTPASQVAAPGPAASAAPRAAVSAPALQGLFPATRESRTLRAERIWPFLAAPLMWWLLAGGLPGLQLMQGQRRSGRRVVLDTRTLADEARQSLPALAPAVAGRLERHVRGDSDLGTPLARRRRLDARRTVEATLRNHGILSPRYRLAPLRPSYLMLIDAHNEHDPRGRLFYLWAERMKREGMAVDIRLFRPIAADPDASPVCWMGGSTRAASGQPLADLDDPSPGQRLVVISEAADWLHTDGRWRAWFERARFARWPQRVFFTPTELRDWGAAEEAVERPEHAADPGFLSLPLDEAALDAWSVLLANGSLPAFSLAEPQRFPRLLASPGFDAFAAPSPADLDRLIAQLKLYLGDSGFRWLAALAVPPLVRWELTLLLGRALFDHRAALIGERWRDVLGRCYRRLARLPWLRGGLDAAGTHHGAALPDWLRLRLLDELPADAQAEIRLVVDRLLSRLRPEAGGELPLDLETPPGHGPGGAAQGAGDALYLGYLSGLTPRQLALRLPGSWSAWLKSERLAEPGWRARAARGAQTFGDWLQALLARLAFRDGLPWSRRRALPLVASLALLAAAVAGVVWLARTPEAELPAALDAAFFETHTRAVTLPNSVQEGALALSPDGRSLLTWGAGAPLRRWDAADGRLLASYGGGRETLAARFSANGQRVLACDERGVVRAWPLEGGEAALIGGPATTELRVDECQIGADGATRLLRNADTGNRLAVSAQWPQGVELPFAAAALLSPNGRWIVNADASDAGRRSGITLRVYNLGAAPVGEAIEVVNKVWLDWAGDDLVVLTQQDSTRELTIHDLRSGDRQRWPLAAATTTSALAVSGDGRHALVGESDGQASLWDLVTGRRIATQQVFGRSTLSLGGLRNLRLADDASVMLAEARDGRLALARAWQEPLHRVAQDADQVAISADGRRFAYSNAAGRIGWGDVGSAAPPVQLDTGLSGAAAFRLLALSADGQRLGFAHADGQLRWWSAMGGAAGGARFDGQPILLGFDTGDAGLRLLAGQGYLYRWSTGSAAASSAAAQNTGGAANVAAWTDAGAIVAAAANAAPRSIVPEGAVRSFSGATRSWPLLRLSNRQTRLWIASLDSAGWRIEAWDLASGSKDEAATLVLPAGVVVADFDADDLRGQLAVVADTGALTLHRLATRSSTAPPDPGLDRLRSARWLPDGRLLTAGSNGLTRIWTQEADGRLVSDQAAIDLGGDLQQLAFSGDSRRLVAAATPTSGGALDVATLALKREIDRTNQLRDAAENVRPADNPVQSKGPRPVTSNERARLNEQIAAAEAAVQRQTTALERARAEARASASVGVWVLPDAVVTPSARTLLTPRQVPGPLAVGSGLLALAALLAAGARQRTRRRLERRLAPPADADAAALPGGAAA